MARTRAASPNPMSKGAMPPDNSGRLLDLIRRFSEQRIAVLGDFVADEFVSGDDGDDADFI